jgi:hypothetical protein
MPQRSELGGRIQTALGDSYEVQRELASGGMATVFLAREKRVDRLVALKVLHPEMAKSVGAQRFRHEVEVASRLEHPNILRVLDHGEAGGDLLCALRDAIRRALSRSRSDRFASISEFASMLQIASSDARAGVGGALTRLASRLRSWSVRA